MRHIIFAVVLAMASSARVSATTELGRKTNGTMILLTKRSPWSRHEDNTVDFDALDSHVKSVDAKMLRGLENYERNTGVSHSLAVKDRAILNLRKRADGITALTSHEHSLWYCTISIGTPPKSFDVQIDTGSSDTFIPGLTCTGCSQQARWDPASSSTAEAKGLEFELEFGDGAACSGDQYTDTVTIAGLTADTQTIGAATAYTGINFPPDGMLGMAFQSISEYHATPLFETLVGKGKVIEPVFSIKLTPEGGELYLGGTNKDLYAGNIMYIPVTVEGFWQVNIQEIRGGNRQTILKNMEAIIDTGSNAIIGDRYLVAHLHLILGAKSVGRGYYSFPCDNFPTISFSFGEGRTLEIHASTLNQGPLRTGSLDCFSAIVGPNDRAHWTLGAIFLETVYTVFDVGNKQVGFARLV